eukprot:Rhum_TRINITY_DN14186_c12_g1::Rhum_TRINITY_DN14186_c12_g1_i1::g.72984::m.72984
MPPKKAKQSAKSENKKKDKIIEDKTFGLKNKNRSKAVQKYVEVVTNSVKSSGSRDQRALDAEREKKKQEKMERQQKELEMKKLYGGVDADKDKKKKKEEEEETAKMDENGEYLWTADDFDEVEEDESRLEEQLEAERTALVGRSDLTPVNEETFQKWWVQKKKSNEDAATKARKAQIKKFKQTGRGISGRALFEHDATLFVDDAGAVEVVEREESVHSDEGAEDEALFDGADLPEDE